MLEKKRKFSDMLFKCFCFMIEFMIFYDEIYDFWTAWPQESPVLGIINIYIFFKPPKKKHKNDH
jgi:hypothetical protein